jgi:hypothetical protein
MMLLNSTQLSEIIYQQGLFIKNMYIYIYSSMLNKIIVTNENYSLFERKMVRTKTIVFISLETKLHMHVINNKKKMMYVPLLIWGGGGGNCSR